MTKASSGPLPAAVAPRKGCVDLNVDSSLAVMFPSSSHPARGAWIEIVLPLARQRFRPASHPARGAWIEMPWFCNLESNFASHPARGAWIEIYSPFGGAIVPPSRTPQGVRGLK